LQEIALNPPNIYRPTTFIPVVRAILPYSYWIIVVLALYIVWSALSGLVGYFSRFLRFGLRIGPILGIIGWVMAASGQGNLAELLEMAKQYTGLSAANNGAGWSPGIASLASMFGANPPTTAGKKSGRGSKANAGSWTDAFTGNADPVSDRTRNKRKVSRDSDPDILSSLLSKAAGMSGEGEGGLPGVVQDYVKNALAKAAGLDWLMGGQQDAEDRKPR
jgi:hypothetical protein